MGVEHVWLEDGGQKRLGLWSPLLLPTTNLNKNLNPRRLGRKHHLGLAGQRQTHAWSPDATHGF